jgi:hypothetical protein
MPKQAVLLIVFSLVAGTAWSNEGEDQANSFANIFSTICLKNLTKLTELRQQLKPLPKLPPEKAAAFIGSIPGDVWPVPDKHGLFVLNVAHKADFCAVFARRANTEAAKALFLKIVEKAPSPLVSKRALNEEKQTKANGKTQTVSYEWSIPDAKKKMLFTLTTSPSDTAEIQVLDSAAIIQN